VEHFVLLHLSGEFILDHLYEIVQDIADYVHNYKIDSVFAWKTTCLRLIDTIGCGIDSLRFPECRNGRNLLIPGPVVEGTIVNGN